MVLAKMAAVAYPEVQEQSEISDREDQLAYREFQGCQVQQDHLVPRELLVEEDKPDPGV